MVWIITKDCTDKMVKKLICLMTNIESNRNIFDEECNLINDQSPFNKYENDYFKDEYRFVKGYVKYTGEFVNKSFIEEKMNEMNTHMRKDITTDLNYCYPTAHYTVARIPVDEYSRLVTHNNQKLKGIKYKYNFIWVNEYFDLNDFQGLKFQAYIPTTYELMRSLSTIIYDNAGVFTTDYHGVSIVNGQTINNVNFPEICQIDGGKNLVNIPITLSNKFGVQGNIRKSFEYLIPDNKKFASNRCIFKDLYYREGICDTGFDIIESKNIAELNIPILDMKESIVKKLKTAGTVYQMIRMNINEYNKSQLTLDIIIKFLSCHICFTPLYDAFYYIIVKTSNPTNTNVPICALCMHNNNSSVLGKLKVGISHSPLTPLDVISLVPRPKGVSYDNYEKYKALINQFTNLSIKNQSIIIESENANGIIFSTDSVKLVTIIKDLTLFRNNNAAIFIVKIIK